VTRFAFFCHSVISDWNHGNAHFLRGLVRALQARGHAVTCYEQVDNWSLDNLLQAAPNAIDEFQVRFPEIRFERYALDDRFEAWLHRRLVDLDVVVVHEFSEAAIDDALRRLTRDVSERLPDLLQKDVFELSFKVGKRTMTETAFFARLTQERIPVASALRELLTTYLTVQPRVVEAKRIFRQIWGPENQA